VLYVDEDGHKWTPDQELTKGRKWGALGGAPVTREETLRISGTPFPEVFRSERFASNGYEFAVPAGVYGIRLHFAETYPFNCAPGLRAFDILINNRRVARNFDPFKEAGGFAKPIVREFTGIPPEKNKLRIELSPGNILNGIEIFRQPRGTAVNPVLQTKPLQLHLSPSENHRYVLSKTIPVLQFDGENVKKWQSRLLPKLRQIVGDMPRERCPLRPRQLWQRQHPLGTIEKIAFTAEPYADVVAYVCLPKGVKPPYIFIICLPGHNISLSGGHITGLHNTIGVQREDETTPTIVAGDRDFGLQCMRQGIAALCIEQRSFGERGERKQGSAGHGCHDATMQALMLGRTLIGERVYDIDRGIDYLAWRGDANMRRIGVMGNSGGGATSMFSAALLARIAFAIPSGYFCTYTDSSMKLFHCMDNYLPGLLKYAEMSDIMGLFAPKPVVLVAGKDDDIFPIQATRRAFKALQRIYAACGAGDRCHLVVGNGGHRFYAKETWPSILNEIERLR